MAKRPTTAKSHDFMAVARRVVEDAIGEKLDGSPLVLDFFGERIREPRHAAAVALYFMYYNFGRVHQTLRVTPAMEAGVSDHVWSVEEIVGLLGA